MEPNRRMSVQLAERAVALDANDAGNHWVLGHVPGLNSIRTTPTRGRRGPRSRHVPASQPPPSNRSNGRFASTLILQLGITGSLDWRNMQAVNTNLPSKLFGKL